MEHPDQRKVKTKEIRLDKRWLTIEMTPKEYARLIGHSEGYVRKYCIGDPEATKVVVRVPAASIVEDIYDVRGKRDV